MKTPSKTISKADEFNQLFNQFLVRKERQRVGEQLQDFINTLMNNDNLLTWEMLQLTKDFITMRMESDY